MLDDPWAHAAARIQSEVEGDVVADATQILIAEQAGVTMAARLTSTGARVRVMLSTSSAVTGIVLEAVPGFVDVLDEQGDAHLINLAAVESIAGLDARLPEPEKRANTRWSLLLRGMEDAFVQVELRSGRWLRGYLGTVGADHVDVITADERITVPIEALTRLRRHHRTDAY